MLVSQAAISSGLTSRPRFGPAKAVPATKITEAIRTRVLEILPVDIANFSFRAYAPGLNRVVVIRVARRVLANPFFTGRLDVPFLINGPALQQYGASIPVPWKSKPGQRQGENRSLQRSLGPA